MIKMQLLINIENRHRAFGDAEATVYLLKNILGKLEKENRITSWDALQTFLEVGYLELPRAIKYEIIASLPQEPGQYQFLDSKGQCIFKGKSSKNLRERIRTHFKKTNQSERSKQFKKSVSKIEVSVSRN